MKENQVFSRIVNWYKLTEMFTRPSRQLPGRWKLFEYYCEPGDRLINIKEEQLKRDSQFWELHFDGQGHLRQSTNLPVQFLDGASACTWHTSGNYIIWLNSGNADIKVKFQYAVVKGNLKLLKKDHTGRIIFFGFFRKVITQ